MNFIFQNLDTHAHCNIKATGYKKACNLFVAKGLKWTYELKKGYANLWIDVSPEIQKRPDYIIKRSKKCLI